MVGNDGSWCLLRRLVVLNKKLPRNVIESLGDIQDLPVKALMY